MSKIIALLSPSINFIKDNFEKIIIVSCAATALYIIYYLTAYSLKKLKPEILSYYPFDKFFPKSGRWSVVYFIITITLLGFLVYFFTKGGFYLAPA